MEREAAGPGEAGGLVVTMTRADLGALVRAAVSAALEASRAVLVDKQGLARALDCSAAHVDHLRKRGLPTVMVGQSVRFETDRVIEWLRAQPRANDNDPET